MTLVPTSYATTSGATNAQPVASSIDLLDESGATSTWANYLQLQSHASGSAYAGTRSFTLPTSLPSSTVTGISVQVNYLGPLKSVQTLTWYIYDWTTSAWVKIGDNSAAQGWNYWTLLTFTPSGTLTDYVRSSDGLIQLKTVSNNTADDANIDYEGVTVTSSAGTAYYVSPTGNDTNLGTIGSPWKTSQKAGNSATPGSTVYFRGGSYLPFDVNVSGSAASGYITFTNYPGESAVIDGTGWTPSFDHGMVNISNQNYITVSGLEIRNATSTTTTSTPDGILVYGPGSNIRILNCNIYDIKNNVANGSAHGILVYGNNGSTAISNLTISGNTVSNLQTGWSESVTLNGNVQFFTISGNMIHDNNNIGIDVAGFYGVSPTGATDQARDGSVTGNAVYNCSTASNVNYGAFSCAGIYVDGGTRVVIDGNQVHNNDIGIAASSERGTAASLPTEYSSYVVARNNVIYANNNQGMSLGGYQSTNGGTQYCTFANNTLYNNDTAHWSEGEINIGYNCSNNIIENNIVYANTQALLVSFRDTTTPGVSPATIDYNDYYSPSAVSASKWNWRGASYIGYLAWQSASSGDVNSAYTDPLFTNPSSPDFRLSFGSPAKNIGNYGLDSSHYGFIDFAGYPRTTGTGHTINMGAFQN